MTNTWVVYLIAAVINTAAVFLIFTEQTRLTTHHWLVRLTAAAICGAVWPLAWLGALVIGLVKGRPRKPKHLSRV